MAAKRVSNVQQFAFADGAERSLSGIRRSFATGGGGVNVQYEEQKTPVPELASAIWSKSAIGGVRYQKFHCIYNYIGQSYTCCFFFL